MKGIGLRTAMSLVALCMWSILPLMLLIAGWSFSPCLAFLAAAWLEALGIVTVLWSLQQ